MRNDLIKRGFFQYAIFDVSKRDEFIKELESIAERVSPFDSRLKERFRFEVMPISPLFILEKRTLKSMPEINAITFMCPLYMTSKTYIELDYKDSYNFSLDPALIDIKKYFRKICINFNDFEGIKDFMKNNIMQLLEEDFNNYDFARVDKMYFMHYIESFAYINSTSEKRHDARMQEILLSMKESTQGIIFTEAEKKRIRVWFYMGAIVLIGSVFWLLCKSMSICNISLNIN